MVYNKFYGINEHTKSPESLNFLDENFLGGLGGS